MQFHPEVTARSLENWFIGHAHEISNTPGISIKQLREDTANYSRRLEVQGHKFWQVWLEKLERNQVFGLAQNSNGKSHRLLRRKTTEPAVTVGQLLCRATK